MNLLITLRIALRALSRNKLRAGLTVLGIVIGIAAVTTMVSIGQSASGLVQGEFQGLGTNIIVVFPDNSRNSGVRDSLAPTLTARDCVALAEDCTVVLATSPVVLVSGQMIYGNSNWSPKSMVGVGPDYPLVRKWQFRQGEFFTDRDVTSAAKVCVIGQTVVKKLFQTTNPIGQTVRIKNIPFQIIGVLEPKGSGLTGEDQDSIVLIPHTTARKRLQGSAFDDVSYILVSARSANQTTEATVEIQKLLNERHRIHPGEAPDFQIENTTEMATVMATITGTLTLMLAAVAGISLLVGGVGIMNIMLVSVTERTREIGIRMAVGARSRDILRQFLVESVLLSSLGGVVGVAVGIGASTGLTMLINSVTFGKPWPIMISFSAAVIAMLFAAAVGVFFGYYPARRASRLDPIDALRYE
jgi:putative ABC transport system permease protein